MIRCEHKDGLPCPQCGEGFNLSLIPEGALHWFRRQRKLTQWCVGLPIIAMCVSSVAYELLRQPAPGEPKLAIFWTLVLLIVSVVLTELLRPKPQLEDARPATLGDFQFPTATEGRVVPILWGKCRVRGPNVVWYGDLFQEAITEKVKTGLWSSEQITKGFRYYLGMQLAVCRGPGVILRKVWIGEDEVYTGTVSTESSFDINAPDLFGGDDYGQGGIVARIDFYPGTTTQGVNSYLNDASRQRVTSATTPTAPRYSGTCHMVARMIPGTILPGGTGEEASGAYLGNAVSIKPWSFELERYPALFSGQTGSQNKVGTDDANPINVIYELLTNTEWGFGFSSAVIDVGAGSTFKDAADTMITEGNGFSMVMDRPLQAKQLLEELQRQIDGVVFLDHRTGKWRVKLVRDDYNIDTVPQLNDSNVEEVQNYTRGSWEDTTNTIQVKFAKRDDEYKESYAVAQDQANAIILAAGNTLTPVGVGASVNYPGVKKAALASNIAWRDLRAQSYPLARATFVVNRQMWSVRVGDVVAWTTTQLGFVKLPMRVTRINYGRLQENKMVLQCVQDVFQYAAASMGTPPPTGWTPPAISLAAYASTDQKAFESPRAIVTRDPQYAGDPDVSKVLCAARHSGNEVGFQIGERHSSGTPSGSFLAVGNVVAFMRIGKLSSAVAAGVANPTSTITVVPDPSSQAAIEQAFDDATTLDELGTELAQLILVGNEMMLVKSAAINGANVDLQNVYRGALDTAQEAHATNDPVYLLFTGAGLTTVTFPNTNNVDIQLRQRSASAVFSGAVTTISLTMAKRPMRPYPPAAILYNGSATAFNTPNCEGDGSGMNGSGFDVDWWRRNFQTVHEINELLADNTGVDASSEYRVTVTVDPGGTPAVAYTGSWVTGSGPEFINRLLLWDEAAAGTEIEVKIEARHDYLTETNIVSRYNQVHVVTPTSTYSGYFYLGGKLRASVVSNTYAAVSTGTFTLRIGAAYSTSNVQVNINSGGWSTVIAAGLTSGTFAANATDNIQVRHTVNETPSPNLVQIEDPGAAVVAYGVLKN